MICFQRTICDKKLQVCIDYDVYLDKKRVFDCIFSTFKKSEKTCQLHYTFYIYNLIKYKEYVDDATDKWILNLLAALEDWYADILNCTILHGSCVEHKGKKILLLGKRKSGKSTLTRYIIFEKKGIYLDDDCIYLIDNKYFGFNMPISTRQNEELVYKDNVLCSEIDDENYSRTLLIPSNTSNSFDKIDYIVFPQYNLNGKNKIVEINGYDLFNSISYNIRHSKNSKELFVDIKNIIAKTNAYVITYNSSDEAIKLIESIWCNRNEKNHQ